MLDPLPIRAVIDEVQSLDVRAVDGHIVWLERRSGQGVLMRRRGTPQDLTAGTNVGSTLGYGGGDFDLSADVVVFASEEALWSQNLTDGPGDRLTPRWGRAG